MYVAPLQGPYHPTARVYCGNMAGWRLWCSGESERKGLALCLGVPVNASVEALVVEVGVKLLCIRRQELAV